jgi:alkyl sulfatase BDS1-like metallo-beta-lactamase superfamily hydrolase
MSAFDRTTATEATRAALESVVGSLPHEDFSDFQRAQRGLLAPVPEQVLGRFGQAVWNRNDFAFLDSSAESPNTVHPSLWRQGQLNNIAGLFEVVPGIYQVRGLDISNITFVRTDTGWVVIDPLTAEETARAAKLCVDEQFGALPVHAVIYTHSHTDHFGGVRGICSDDDVASGRVVIWAPEGFMESAVSENVIAGTVMLRRSMYMFGVLLPKDPQGLVDTGLGKTLPAMPLVGLIPPTHHVSETGQTVSIDGLEIVFQNTPGTEAPSEMNMYFPKYRALCMAENCTANLHNLLTLRGAQVRDALAWSKYIHEALLTWGPVSDVAFASHHWPRWGQQEIHEYLADQRDLYRYLHDQTMRLANHGLTAPEIAEEISLTPELAGRWYLRDYYGTVRHNSRAVYQRYLGWFDGVPAHLNPHPPVAAGERYVALAGGSEALLTHAREAYASGDYRWVAEVVNHLVFADPGCVEARELLASAYEQLGYQSESGVWRNFYLTGALELRAGGCSFRGVRANAAGPWAVSAMTIDMLMDLIGVRMNGPALSGVVFTLAVALSDRPEAANMGVRAGAVHLSPFNAAAADALLTTPHAAFAAFAGGNLSLDELLQEPGVSLSVHTDALREISAALETFSFGFEIVLP